MLNTSKFMLSILTAILLLPFSWSVALAQQTFADSPERAELFDALSSAKTEMEGREAEGAVWSFWFEQAPSEEVRRLLDAGMERREAYDYEAAEAFLDEVVALAPDYAEGHNQRAFVRFLRENYSDAQTDLDRALELEPDHFAAMSGLYHILSIQNRQDAALGLLKQAVAIHPWLRERSALPETHWPESYRDIHKGDEGI